MIWVVIPSRRLVLQGFVRVWITESWLPVQAGCYGYCNTHNFVCFVILCKVSSLTSTMKMEMQNLLIGKN